jgi:thioredoxin reductase
VLICDRGTPRSWASKALYGFLSRDGIDPAEFRRIARRELRRYPNVELAEADVDQARRRSDGTFEVCIGNERIRCRKLLIATGLLDQLPPIPEIERYFGTSVFQCPYCDGWELRGQPVAVYGRRERGYELARAMTAWSRDIVLCTDGGPGPPAHEKAKLLRNGIRLNQQRIQSLSGAKGKLRAIEFRDGSTLARKALFFDTPCSSQSRLAESLGCQFNRRGGVKCGRYEATSVPGVFVAGNIIKNVQLSIVAAAEGASAAFGINRSLTREDFERRATGTHRVEHPALGESQA